MNAGILIVCSFVAALISGAAGFGGSLLLLPAATALLGAELAVPVMTIAQLIGNASRMAFGFRQIEWKSVGWFCLTALPLAALGAFGFTLLPKGIVTRCIGAALLALAVLQLTGKLSLHGGKRTLLLGGAATGFLSGLCGSGGPIGAAVFLTLGLPPVAYIASEAATATAMHVLKTAIYGKLIGLTPSALLTGLAMGAAMALGAWVANRFIRRAEKGKYRAYVGALLCVFGAYMLLFGA